MEERIGGTAIRTLFGIGLLAAIVSGCSGKEEIRRYSVQRVSSVPDEELPDGLLVPGSGEPTRMLAAIIPRGRQTWFFKLTGPDDTVAQEVERFREFLQSIRFSEAETPEFTLPGGWQRFPGTGMRFATLMIGPADALMELTVIPLPTGSGPLQDYVLANINRWREQLGLPSDNELTVPDDSEAMWTLAVDDKSSLTAVNLAGSWQGQDMPTAGGERSLPPGHPPIDGGGTVMPKSTVDSPVRFSTPEGWIAGTSGGLRAAAFDVRDGEQHVEITLISLPVSGGDRLENVNRWREQLGLGPLRDDELSATLQPIRVSGRDGQFVELTGPESVEQHESILAALVDRDNLTWFFKLRGDAPLAERERGRFLQFVESTSFGADEQP